MLVAGLISVWSIFPGSQPHVINRLCVPIQFLAFSGAVAAQRSSTATAAAPGATQTIWITGMFYGY